MLAVYVEPRPSVLVLVFNMAVTTECSQSTAMSLDTDVRTPYLRENILQLCSRSSHSTLFYVGGIFCAGLLVDSNNPLLAQNEGTVYSSPFVIAFQNAGVGFVGALSFTSSSVSLIVVCGSCFTSSTPSSSFQRGPRPRRTSISAAGSVSFWLDVAMPLVSLSPCSDILQGRTSQ